MIELIKDGATTCIDSSYNINYNGTELSEVWVCDTSNATCVRVWNKENAICIYPIICCDCKCATTSYGSVSASMNGSTVVYSCVNGSSGRYCISPTCFSIQDHIQLNMCYDQDLIINEYLIFDGLASTLLATNSGNMTVGTISSCCDLTNTVKVIDCCQISGLCTEVYSDCYSWCHDYSCNCSFTVVFPDISSFISATAKVDVECIYRCIEICNLSGGLLTTVCEPLSCSTTCIY